MKIIGFSGSPRKNGNTSWAVEQILNGSNQAGAETVLFSSSDFDIKPCRGCYGCKNGDNGCGIKDDMQKVYAELKDADAVVFASPVYMGQMTGQAWETWRRTILYRFPRFSSLEYFCFHGKIIMAIFWLYRS